MIERIKNKISDYYKSESLESVDIDESTEKVLDYLMDEDLVDLSEDEYGDMYEQLHNEVYDYLESLQN